MQSPSQPRHPSQILQDIRSEYEKRNNLTTQAAQKQLSKMCHWKESTWGNLERSTLVSGQEWKDEYSLDMIWGNVIKENSRYHIELIAWERIRDVAAEQAAREEYLQQQAREQQAGEQQPDPTKGEPPIEAVMAVKKDKNVVNGDNNGGGRGRDKRKWYWIAGLGGCAVLLLLCALGVTTAYLYVQREQLARQTPAPPVVIEKEVTPVVIEKEVTRIVEVPKIEATMAPEQTKPVEATRPPSVVTGTTPPEPTPSTGSATETPVIAVSKEDYRETGRGKTELWDFDLKAGEVLIIGGFTVDYETGGVFKAWKGPQKLRVTVVDGFAIVIPYERGESEFQFRINQARQNNWAITVVKPLPEWHIE